MKKKCEKITVTTNKIKKIARIRFEFIDSWRVSLQLTRARTN